MRKPFYLVLWALNINKAQIANKHSTY